MIFPSKPDILETVGYFSLKLFFCKLTANDEQADFSPSTSVFRHTGNYIFTPPKSVSVASSKIYTHPRLCLTLVLKSILPNIVSAASSKLLVENYFLMYVFS